MEVDGSVQVLDFFPQYLRQVEDMLDIPGSNGN